MTATEKFINRRFELGNLNAWTYANNVGINSDSQFTYDSDLFSCRIVTAGSVGLLSQQFAPIDDSTVTTFQFYVFPSVPACDFTVMLTYDDMTTKSVEITTLDVGQWSGIDLTVLDATGGGLLFDTSKHLTAITITPASMMTIYVDDFSLIGEFYVAPTVGGGGANILDETNREETFSSLTPEQQKAYLDAKKRLVEESEQRLQSEQK